MNTGLTVSDLAGFTGRTESYYGSFVVEALSQATDLFELATELPALPSDGLRLRIAVRGILEMAENIYEGQQYRELRFTPFRSQTIGSYSYQLAERAVLQGIPTGIAWFDNAVSLLTLCPSTKSTSVSVFDRPGDVLEVNGRKYLLGPADARHESLILDSDSMDTSIWPGSYE